MHTVSGVNLHGDHPEKRPHSPEPEPPKKSAKTIKQCPICTSEVQSFPLSPESCGAGHEATSFGERACGECWEAHLGLQIQESPFGMVTCLFCGGFINEADLERLARKGTYESYLVMKEAALNPPAANSLRCSYGEPGIIGHDKATGKATIIGVCNHHQRHIRATDGRVFDCGGCSRKWCIDCDKPEHEHQSCKEYRDRVEEALRVKHPFRFLVKKNKELVEMEIIVSLAEADRDTEKALTSKVCKRCPMCHAYLWREAGCAYSQCSGCKHRFCFTCEVPWVGTASIMLNSEEGHKEGCYYRTRGRVSKHALPGRFERVS